MAQATDDPAINLHACSATSNGVQCSALSEASVETLEDDKFESLQQSPVAQGCSDDLTGSDQISLQELSVGVLNDSESESTDVSRFQPLNWLSLLLRIQ